MVIDSSGTIHVAWSSIEESSDDDYQIFYSKSPNNGGTWSSEIMLSGEDTSSSISPRMDHDDGKVHITWEEYDDVNGYYQTMYSKSTDNGNSFSAATKLSGTSTVSAVTVTASGSDVLVGGLKLILTLKMLLLNQEAQVTLVLVLILRFQPLLAMILV